MSKRRLPPPPSPPHFPLSPAPLSCFLLALVRASAVDPILPPRPFRRGPSREGRTPLWRPGHSQTEHKTDAGQWKARLAARLGGWATSDTDRDTPLGEQQAVSVCTCERPITPGQRQRQRGCACTAHALPLAPPGIRGRSGSASVLSGVPTVGSTWILLPCQCREKRVQQRGRYPTLLAVCVDSSMVQYSTVQHSTDRVQQQQHNARPAVWLLEHTPLLLHGSGALGVSPHHTTTL